MPANRTSHVTIPVRRIVFFDGVCTLCQASVQFILQRDKSGQFLFASLQGELAHQLLPDTAGASQHTGSIILWEEGKIYDRSTAVLRIAKRLSGLWPMLYVFILLPAFIRDAVYGFIARNRYRWWGKTATCLVPKPEWAHRFPTTWEE
ncbi:MAG: thiol-disulfide oxidoreductase DCC family protein [Bacteroidota bacterium]